MIADLSLNEVAERVGVTRTYLLDIESEGCGPSKDVLQQLMGLYGLTIRNLHTPPGQDRRTEATSTRNEIDWISLMLKTEAMTNRELLNEVATAVRTLRRLSATVPVHMRQPEADLLVSMLDLDDEDLAIQIMSEFGLSVAQTNDFIDGAVNRARQRANGDDSQFLRRLSGIKYAIDVEQLR